MATTAVVLAVMAFWPPTQGTAAYQSPSPTHSAATPMATVPPSPSASQSVGQSRSPSATAAAPVVAAPIQVTISNVGIDAAVRPASPGPDGLTPGNLKDVWWWQERGKVGPSSLDTVYLFAHTNHTGWAVFNRLQDAKVGDSVLITTSNGTFRYVIDRVDAIPEAKTSKTDALYAPVSGRLVLISCLLKANGQPQDHNFVAFGHYTGVVVG